MGEEKTGRRGQADPGGGRELLSVVVPVFDEAETVDAFYERAKSALDPLSPMSYELVFVDDGSRDGSFEKLAGIADRDPRVRIVKLSRNFGHQNAVTAGIDAARGDAVVIIDADLQDPPEVIPGMIRKWREGFDVVYGVRETREGEKWMKRYTASLFYRVMKRVTRVEIPVDVGDFRLMSRRVVDNFNRIRERDRFIRGLVSWVGFRQAGVLYRRERRFAGETKYPLSKMIRFSMDGITSFSHAPLKIATWLGYGVSFIALLYTVVIIFEKFMGMTVPGFASIMAGMLFLGGVQLICLGIMGEYVGRIFNETKGRPIYILEEIYEKPPAAGNAPYPAGDGGSDAATGR
ncbi:MAG: glycosyl transferase family protein [Deltaproteobacteria bacterium]|nr:glycosyl transferase family protein [Deltaproteobacteria bacterium]